MTASIAWMRGCTHTSPGKRVTPFGSAQPQRDQNSAGRYPLISSPMQISTRVGVVQAIGPLP